jgi:hypothetical protein
MASALVNIRSAMFEMNQSFTNLSATVSGTTGQEFCIDMISQSGVYAWQVVPNGTIVSVTANLMGSLDGANWFQLDTMSQNDTAGYANGIAYTGWSSTAGEMRWVTGRPCLYLRIDPIAINGGGTVTGSFCFFDPNR